MATPDPERYLAVLKASYDYSPQSDDEIEIKEDQVLFLVERTDDDWWKVKIKGSLQDAETPVGLVPAAYVEQAEHDHIVKALYDYEAAAPGELTIHEDDILLAFDSEGDWLLVQSKSGGGGAGYVPENYVEESAGDEVSSTPAITLPSNPRPVSTYVDPADRVAASKVAIADDIKTWSVSEVDKKGKKKKGTLGIGNGAVFFASESDKTPVQKWDTADVTDITSEKSKHVKIEISGATPVTLLFNVGSKDNVEEITRKLETSRDLSRPSEPASPPNGGQYAAPSPLKSAEKGTVRFSPASPTIIPPREDEDEVEEEEDHPTTNGHSAVPQKGVEDTAVVLYEFQADGDDELTVAEDEVLTVLERDGNEWWKCRNARGAEGVVPASYLELKPGASKVAASVPPPGRNAKEEEEKAEAARAAQEAADRVKAELMQQEEEERAAKERKKSEAQRRAREAAAAAEAERQKRKEAASAAAKRSPTISNKTDRPSSSSTRKSQDVKFPPAEQVRTWHDRTGQFRVDAAFVGFNGGKFRLHKINGVIVEVPSEKMSVDDIKFVEKLTRKSGREGRGSSQAQKETSEDDIPLGTLQTSVSNSQSQAPPATNQKQKGPRIDWFDFFLGAGCDVDDCTRYTAAFERDKIDESILSDITDSTMRSLGLREGDIIRVKKAIDKRKPGENMEKQSAHLKEQMKRDEELARQLQAQETGGGSSKSPAPNLFAGPGGVLKPHRGRRKDTTVTLPKSVDRNMLSSASEQIQRTTSPATTIPASRPDSAPAQPARPGSLPDSTPAASSGFEDDAWAPRPSSTKPTPTASVPAPQGPVSSPTPPVPSSSAPPSTVAPAAINATAPAPAPAPATTSRSLAQTTESDVFDQLARLSQLRVTPQPPVQQQQQMPTTITPTTRVASPPFNPGLGIGNSQFPINQSQTQPVGLLQSQSHLSQPPQQSQPQAYNGPRGPFAPVPSNQGLLQPLIPTQTGFNSFIPTRASSIPPPSTMPYQNQLSPPSFVAPQPTGFLNTGMQQSMIPQQTGMQPSMIPQQTGMPGLSPSPFSAGSMNASPFGSGSSFMSNPTNSFSPSPNLVQPTGVFAQSPFDAPMSPPMSPPGNSNANSTAPANVFASMKSGTFAKDEDHSTPQSADKYNALRPNLAQQPTGWGYSGYSGF